MWRRMISVWEFGRNSGKKIDKNLDLRAVWVSYLETDDFLQHSDGSEKAFREFAERIAGRSKDMGLNCIIFQVRPFGDALYDSELFPWSEHISSSQGVSPGYDPLKIMTAVCHRYNLRIEAWVNPYRIGSDTSDFSKDNPALPWIQSKSRNVLKYQGMYYYNPSKKEVRKLIARGVKELVKKYDIDGIHLDDYFYPDFSGDNAGAVFDAGDYKAGVKAGRISASTSLSEWRKQNVSDLIRLLYKEVKEEDPSVTFGVSPNGNPEDLTGDNAYYVDLDRWIHHKGYIDYIMPQLYWGYGNRYSPFEETSRWWDDALADSDVILYAGLPVYKIGAPDYDEGNNDEEEMKDPDLIIRQIRTLDDLNYMNGYCLFSYRYLDPDNPCFFADEDKDTSERVKLLGKLSDKLLENGSGDPADEQ